MAHCLTHPSSITLWLCLQMQDCIVTIAALLVTHRVPSRSGSAGRTARNVSKELSWLTLFIFNNESYFFPTTIPPPWGKEGLKSWCSAADKTVPEKQYSNQVGSTADWLTYLHVARVVPTSWWIYLPDRATEQWGAVLSFRGNWCREINWIANGSSESLW